MFLAASFSDGPTFDRPGAVAITRTWPTGSLPWADTPEARLMTGTKPGHVPGFSLPAVWLAELAGGADRKADQGANVRLVAACAPN